MNEGRFQLPLPAGGLGARAAPALRALRRRLRMRLWFPHVPLFLMVLYLGVRQFQHALHLGLFARVANADVLQLSTFALTEVLSGAPSASAGVFLFVMAFGLLTRSRLAWVVALLATLVSLVLVTLVWRGGPYRATLVYNVIVLVALLASGRGFRRSSLTSASLFAIASITVLIAYAVIGTYLLGPHFSPPITDLITAFYYAVETMTTVGYGDIVPKTANARLFAISVMVLGIATFATSVSALLVPLVNRRMASLLGNGEKKVARSNHYVITSDSPLARNTANELMARDQVVAFILPAAPDPGADKRDVVVGDPSDLDVLHRADAQDAKAVLALGPDDFENAFVVMAVRELSPRIKTVAVVHDARNMERVKRVRPDVILAPQVLGGELLAMALSGEAVDSDKLMRSLLHISE